MQSHFYNTKARGLCAQVIYLTGCANMYFSLCVCNCVALVSILWYLSRSSQGEVVHFSFNVQSSDYVQC